MSPSVKVTPCQNISDFGDHQNYKENETSVCFEKGGRVASYLFLKKKKNCTRENEVTQQVS